MASSRWKRFAFFERHSLSLASEVLEDIIPIGGSSSNTTVIDNGAAVAAVAKAASAKISTATATTSRRRSLHSLNEAAEASSNDNVSLVVTTASLPLNSKPPSAAIAAATNAIVASNNNHDLALNDMWSSLAACNPMDLPGTETGDQTVKLPSQSQAQQAANPNESNLADSSTNTSSAAASNNHTSVDGLVLAFVASRGTNRVHCFDVTVRCTPPSSKASTATSTFEKDLEDLDGWRGYFAPFNGRTTGSAAVTTTATRTKSTEDRIIAEHLQGKGGGDDMEASAKTAQGGMVAMATTRATSGHRPVHMACIRHNDLVVCVDPHLFLSWYACFSVAFFF